MKKAALFLFCFWLTTCAAWAQNWRLVNEAGFGNAQNNLLSWIVYNNRLIVATGTPADPQSGITGNPIEIWAYDGSSWSQINTDGFGDANNIPRSPTEMAVHGGNLYVGADNSVDGIGIWRYNGTTWTQVNTNGFGSGYYYRVVTAMASYDGQLYVSSPNEEVGIALWATPDGTDWTTTNFYDQGNDAAIDALAVYGNQLYAGFSSSLTGFQLLYLDGAGWVPLVTDGLGDTVNTTINDMLVFNNQLMVSVQNAATGNEIWAYNGTDWSQINIDGFGRAENIGSYLSIVGGYLYANVGNVENGGALFRYDGSDWTTINQGGMGDPRNLLLQTIEYNGLQYLGTASSVGDAISTSVAGISIYRLVPPVANTGDNFLVEEGEGVQLDGSYSTYSSDDTFQWTQIYGTVVTLADATAARTTFVTPSVGTAGAILEFQLTVTDVGGLQSSDTVRVTVLDNGVLGFGENLLAVKCKTGRTFGIAAQGASRLTDLRTDFKDVVTDTVQRPRDMPYGLVDVAAKVPNAGDTAVITIQLATPALAGYKWYKYMDTSGWMDFSRDLISGGTGDGAEFSADRLHVTLYVTDNGPYDEDPAENLVRDPSGLGSLTAAGSTPAPGQIVQSQPDTESQGNIGCFIGTLIN